MPIRFRKSIKVAPGLRLNLSKSGVSTSIGSGGLRYVTPKANGGCLYYLFVFPFALTFGLLYYLLAGTWAVLKWLWETAYQTLTSFFETSLAPANQKYTRPLTFGTMLIFGWCFCCATLIFNQVGSGGGIRTPTPAVRLNIPAETQIEQTVQAIMTQTALFASTLAPTSTLIPTNTPTLANTPTIAPTATTFISVIQTNAAQPPLQSTQPPRLQSTQPPSTYCCKYCGANSQPCGDSCISLSKTCHKAPGCACK